MTLHGLAKVRKGAQSRFRLTEKLLVRINTAMHEGVVGMQDAYSALLKLKSEESVLVAVLRTTLVKLQLVENPTMYQHVEWREVLVRMTVAPFRPALWFCRLLVAHTKLSAWSHSLRIAQGSAYDLGTFGNLKMAGKKTCLRKLSICINKEQKLSPTLTNKEVSSARRPQVGTCLKKSNPRVPNRIKPRPKTLVEGSRRSVRADEDFDLFHKSLRLFRKISDELVAKVFVSGNQY